MASLMTAECSICEDPLNKNDDVVVTDCEHVFHRACALNRIKKNKRTDCHKCEKASAIADALERTKLKVKTECKICENPMNEDDDIVITDCDHVFHRACAQKRFNKKKRTDCYVCRKSSAIADVLLLDILTNNPECKMCENPLHKNDELVITDCRHAFHRTCAQKRFNKNKRTDCYVCGKLSVIDDVFDEDPTVSTTIKSTEPKPTRPQSFQDTHQDTVGKHEHYWECAACSRETESSKTRCQSCGEPRYTPAANPNVVAIEEIHERHPNVNSPPSSLHSQRITTTDMYDSGMNAKSPKDTRKPVIRSRTPSPPQSEAIVYVTNLPLFMKDDSTLTRSIRHRVENTFQIIPIDIQCYSILGAGFLRVRNKETKDRLVDIGNISLDRRDGSTAIFFSETLEIISYVVISATNEKNDADWPSPEEVSRQWAKTFQGEKLSKCEVVNVMFPNIYRIVSTSFDQLIKVISNQDFSIQGRCARVFLNGNCSYFEDLPKPINDEQLRQAISKKIGQSIISSLYLHIEFDKTMNNVCIIAADIARIWATETSLYLGDKPLMKKADLTCRLLLRQVPKNYDANTIVNHQIFAGKAMITKRRGTNLILEISDKNVFDECLRKGILRIDDRMIIPMEVYVAFSDPEDNEIDANTWYGEEMFHYMASIMSFVDNFEHKIFHYKWNPQVWIEQLQLTTQNQTGRNQNLIRNGRSISANDRRHYLRVTVMLNTIGAIRKKKYRIGEQEFDLQLNPNLKTVLYNHQSKLQSAGPIPIITPPYPQTTVKVKKEDCLIAYERLVREGKRPVLLNMANQTSPGGGYRKGDGAQEENLFRRSDYFRSLDIGLDHIEEQITNERCYCTSTGDLDSRNFNLQEMYPMDDYGAIYTSGLTVFRQSEDTGYAYMENALRNVCALAMAAYRDPKLDGNLLATKYAVGMRKKIENIFAIAYHHNHDCLILSAFGCGAFRNPPDHVAKIFQSVIDQYAGFFQVIIFAIIDDHNTGHDLNPQGNFSPFQRQLDRYVVQATIPSYQPNTMFGPYRFLGDGMSVGDVFICDLPPCQFGAHCKNMYSPDHAKEYSHPPWCAKVCLNEQCTQTKDNVHLLSFMHRNPCGHGVKCRMIDDKKHAREFDHPPFCPAGSACQDTTEDHEKTYRHLPLCGKSHKCMEYQKKVKGHCEAYRHCTLRCKHGNSCADFHDRSHLSEYDHPFPRPCPWTPYNCKFHDMLTQTRDSGTLSEDVHRHCLKYAHVCRYGRDCHDKSQLHWDKSIHVPRLPCPFGDKCNKLMQEDHLNSYTHRHQKIHDIRRWCKHADRCYTRCDPKHIAGYRHGMAFEDSGVICYFNLNENINFVQNQKDNIERVTHHIKKEKWERSQSISKEIIDWIRTVQPVHRCEPHIFESILLQGHVMSREYMKNLQDRRFVVNAVLQQTQIRQITDLQIEPYKTYAYKYVHALVTEEYKKCKFSAETTISANYSTPASTSKFIEDSRKILSTVITRDSDMQALRDKAIDIAKASYVLSLTPMGIGHPPDEKLQTNRHVFSILGPHLGSHYGNIVLIFKREVLHHPDANFSIQAGTSYYSGKAFDWRPWLGKDLGTPDERVQLFHSSKLHASIPGYEYATALELIALTNHVLKPKKKTMNIGLDQILERWCKVDSHQVIEAHLPQLIPLDYIDHVYIPQNIWNYLKATVRHTVEIIFKGRFTVKDSPTDKEYNALIVQELIQRFGKRDIHSLPRPIQGTVITIPSTKFTDHYLVPLTISQAYEQYRIDHPRTSAKHSTYIYWHAMNGDMMLTLSKEQTDPRNAQPPLRYLMCYVAEKPSSTITHGSGYHEEDSYLNLGLPIQHNWFMSKRQYAARSGSFYVGCNTDDFMTFCLEIQYSTGSVILSHAGPNSIYNHETISCKFSEADLDFLNQLNFIYVSAGEHTVPIRNLIICFEKQVHLHPTIDTNFEKGSSIHTATSAQAKYDRNENDGPSTNKADEQLPKSPGVLTRMTNAVKDTAGSVVGFFSSNNDLSLKPCPDSINCLRQFSKNAAAEAHNQEYSHPCRFAELCNKPEPHLTHEPRQVSQCDLDNKCPHLCDPIHRVQYRHTGWPYFLIPCHEHPGCSDKSRDHRIRYSHGEPVLEAIQSTTSNPRTRHTQDSAHHQRKPGK